MHDHEARSYMMILENRNVIIVNSNWVSIVDQVQVIESWVFMVMAASSNNHCSHFKMVNFAFLNEATNVGKLV